MFRQISSGSGCSVPCRTVHEHELVLQLAAPSPPAPPPPPPRPSLRAHVFSQRCARPLPLSVSFPISNTNRTSVRYIRIRSTIALQNVRASGASNASSTNCPSSIVSDICMYIYDIPTGISDISDRVSISIVSVDSVCACHGVSHHICFCRFVSR
eukprot:SAG31_NODE_773_length_12173_cov_15.778173_9_plen_155_part_00